MEQINQQIVEITAISDTSLTTNIDSSLYDPLITPSDIQQVPQIVPVGEIASTLEGATVNTRV